MFDFRRALFIPRFESNEPMKAASSWPRIYDRDLSERLKTIVQTERKVLIEPDEARRRFIDLQNPRSTSAIKTASSIGGEESASKCQATLDIARFLSLCESFERRRGHGTVITVEAQQRFTPIKP